MSQRAFALGLCPKELHGKVDLDLSKFSRRKRRELATWFTWLETGDFVFTGEIPAKIEGSFWRDAASGCPLATYEVVWGIDVEARMFLAGLAGKPARYNLVYEPGPVFVKGQVYLESHSPGCVAPGPKFKKEFATPEECLEWYHSVMDTEWYYERDGTSRPASWWFHHELRVGNLSVFGGPSNMLEAIEAAKKINAEVTAHREGIYIEGELGFLSLAA